MVDPSGLSMLILLVAIFLSSAQLMGLEPDSTGRNGIDSPLVLRQKSSAG